MIEYVNLSRIFIKYTDTLSKVEFGVFGTRFAPNFRHFHIIMKHFIHIEKRSVTVTNNNKLHKILVSIVIGRGYSRELKRNAQATF